MENVDATKVLDGKGRNHFFMTWGRAFDALNDQQLLEAISPHLPTADIGTVRELRVCDSLQAASKERCFYEALFCMSREKSSYGNGYGAWCIRMRRRIRSGKEIYYLGKQATSKQC